MWLKMRSIFVIVMYAVYVDAGGKGGDSCTKDGVIGICKDQIKCPAAIQDIKNKNTPQICSFNNENPIVCCVDNIASTTVSGHTTADGTTTEYKPSNAYIYEEKDGCDPIPPSITASKNGRKAWDRPVTNVIKIRSAATDLSVNCDLPECIEYQRLVYPCGKNATLTGQGVRVNKCHHDVAELILGGSQARPHELPHAALLGYGNNSNSDKLQWLCGGALISDQFILSAAQCAYSYDYGPVTYAALRMTSRDNIDPQHQYKVKKVIRHPEYKSLNKYHDIALLELEKPILLDSFTVPACLDTGDSERENALSTSTHDALNKDGVLQKLRLSKFSTAECTKLYPGTRKFPPFNGTSQLCYGDPTQSLDICQDDGGSPLLVENQKVSCMYTIIGVTSYGRRCFSHGPGVYVKVAYYLPWIEGIVWP